jgi:hypothetical protein
MNSNTFESLSEIFSVRMYSRTDALATLDEAFEAGRITYREARLLEAQLDRKAA